MINESEKNPIALLHEYCSKTKTTVTYNYDIKGAYKANKKE